MFPAFGSSPFPHFHLPTLLPTMQSSRMVDWSGKPIPLMDTATSQLKRQDGRGCTDLEKKRSATDPPIRVIDAARF